MPEIIPMNYKLFPLTVEESKTAKHWGWKFVSEHKDRWVDADCTNYELQTYDRGISCVVYENNVYHIERDFIDMDSNCRVYVGRRRNLQTDITEVETSVDDTEVSTEEVPEETQESKLGPTPEEGPNPDE